MGVDASAQVLERRRVEILTRRDQPVALSLPPGFHFVGGQACLLLSKQLQHTLGNVVLTSAAGGAIVAP
jgi:hypothetical protein